MKLFLYYAFCSIKNQIHKLFKTWVAVFFVVCFAFGILVGLGATMLEDLAADFAEEDTMSPEETPDEEFDDTFEEEPMTEEELRMFLKVVELGLGAAILLMLVWKAFASDKSGCVIFQQADVNLLFSSPMKPQSVLLFRLMTQIGATFALSIYLGFQIPNFVINLGLSIWVCLGLIAALILLILLGQLLQILLYTIGSTHPRIKSRIRPITVGILGVIAAAYVLYWQTSALPPLEAALAFFNAPASRFIPIWGWLKGFCMYVIEGNILGIVLTSVANLATTVLLIWIIWHIRADFYEDAMAKSEETAAAQAAAAEGRSIQRKKDRGDRLRRDELKYGQGANVYFFKAMYNRFRFAHFHVFTKTAETYLIAALGVSLLLKFVIEINDITAVALVLAGFAFFRSLGNPIMSDTSMDSFVMVPESPWAKVFWSTMGGSLNCLLDLLPALLVATVILGVNPLITLAWMVFILSLDFYSANVGIFIDFSIPTSVAKNIKGVIQIMFIYFGLLPDIVLLILGGIFGLFPLFAGIAAALNLFIGGIFFAFSPMFLAYGRK